MPRSRPSLDGLAMRAGIAGLLGVALVAVAAISLAVSVWAAGVGEPVVGFTATQPVELTGAPGERLHLTLLRENVLRYATDGLELRLGDRRSEAVGEAEKTWDEAVSGDVDDIEVGVDVPVPDLGPGAVIEGTIEGRVTFAVPAGNGQFRDQSETVDVPLRVNVVTPEASAAFAAERRGTAGVLVVPALVLAGIAGAAGLIALLVAVALGLWVTLHSSFGRQRSTGDARLWHVAAAGFSALIAIVSVLFGIAFGVSWLSGPRTDLVPLAFAIGLVIVGLWALLAAREEWLEHRMWPAAVLALAMLGGGVIALIGDWQRWLPEVSRLGDRPLWELALLLMLGAALALSTSAGMAES